jgi:hypothetical protein
MIDFLGVFIRDVVTLAHINKWPGITWSWLFLALIMIGVFVSGYMVFLKKDKKDIVFFTCSIVSVLILCSAVYLNKYRMGFHWHTFRHFFGYLGLWWVSVLYLPIRFVPEKGEKYIFPLIAGIMTVATVFYFKSVI